MKAVIVAPFFDSIDKMSFGPHPFIHNLVKGLNKKIDVQIITSGWPKHKTEEIVEGVKVFRVPTFPYPLQLYKGPYLSFSFGLKKILQEKPDVVNVQDFDGVMLLRLLAKRCPEIPRILSLKSLTKVRVKAIYGSHSFVEKVFVNVQDYFESIAFNNADNFVVPSNFFMNKMLLYHPNFFGRITKVYNGIDLNVFKPLKTPDRNQLLFVGGKSERKGYKFALKTFAALKKSFSDLKLVFVGSKNVSDCRELSELSAKELKDITCIERVPYHEMPALINESTIVLNPSLQETFGTVNAETMACSKPVVAFKASVMPEILDDSALQANFLSESDFIEKTRILLDDKQLRLKIGRKGLARARKLFDLNDSIKNYVNLFKETVEGGKN
ncbi:MAG: glycosyltransferase family 4 protein [archaeon]